MKYIFLFISKMGQVLLIYSLMIVTAIFLYSKFNTGKVIYGNRCIVKEIPDLEKYIEIEEINNIHFKQECNTIYLTLTADLTKEEYTGIIMRYYEKFKNINYDGNIQITAYSSLFDTPLFASITKNGISIN